MDLPSHELLLQPRKFKTTDSFREEIFQLIFGTKFDKYNIARSDMFPKPVILDCVMLRPWSHSRWLQFSQSKSTKDIFVDFDMHVVVHLQLQVKSGAELLCNIN
jgi:hypothetical protein